MDPNQSVSLLEQDNALKAEFLKLNKPAAYGTAGFRDLAVNMPYITFRAGIFVALLNKTIPSKSLGIVISASHNKKEDNGLKITNFKGNMLERNYQSQIQKFINQPDLMVAIQNFKTYLIGKQKSIFEVKVTVFIGGDTRPSTPSLLILAAKGVKSQNGATVNFNITTTPQLQYYVYLHNEHLKPKEPNREFAAQEIRSQYWKNFSSYFKTSANYLKWEGPIKRTIDCANGVGGKIMPQFSKMIEKQIEVELRNFSDDENLNNKCGADHVKVAKTFPLTHESRPHNSFLSFDGDADRIVFYQQNAGKLQLIDGDRIGTVLTQFFNKLSKELADKTKELNDSAAGLYFNIPLAPSIGFVQTYYANSSSSEYLEAKYGMKPVFAATGVKYLHEKAEHYDIGIYFEANGHGTVIFKDNYFQRIDALLVNKQFLLAADFVKKNEETVKALERYYQFLEFYMAVCRLSNPSVGDAICAFLLFEIALKYLNITYDDTLKMYTDLESLTSKVSVKSKESLKVTDIEDKVISPANLQPQIESILAKYQGKKAFLRASGTENVLRLHVEAKTKEQVQIITREVQEIVYRSKELN